jgi:predicted nucleic acid-binding protein
VEGFLLNTSALTPAVDPGHTHYSLATKTIESIGTAPLYVSAIALGEMIYGFELYKRSTGVVLPDSEKMLEAAKLWPRLDVTHHTVTVYAELKAALAVYCLPNVTKQFRKRYVEDWINQFTGKALRVDDNDLWICAQAREMNLVLVRGDRGMQAMQIADPLLKLMLIGETI